MPWNWRLKKKEWHAKIGNQRYSTLVRLENNAVLVRELNLKGDRSDIIFPLSGKDKFT